MFAHVMPPIFLCAFVLGVPIFGDSVSYTDGNRVGPLPIIKEAVSIRVRVPIPFTYPPSGILKACDPTDPLGLVNFETMPGVTSPKDGMAVSNQYKLSHGIVFCRDADGNGFCDASDLPANIAQVGAPLTAFSGYKKGADTPDPMYATQIGQFFLTEDNDYDSYGSVVIQSSARKVESPTFKVGSFQLAAGLTYDGGIPNWRAFEV